MASKECSVCKRSKKLDNFYKQSKTRSDGTKYEYVNPECKECTSKRAMKWQYDNYDRWKEIVLDRCKKEEVRMAHRATSKKRRLEGYQKEYQKNNRDKIREYNTNRRRKNHDITEKEWGHCKEYFKYSCAYCGITEQRHLKEYNQQLHKEHVHHNGADDLSNCVPSCKSCNSQKWSFPLDEWYSEDNEVFTAERERKIYKWLGIDYQQYIEQD